MFQLFSPIIYGIGKILNFVIYFVICVYMIKTIPIVYLDIILKYMGTVSDVKK